MTDYNLLTMILAASVLVFQGLNRVAIAINELKEEMREARKVQP